MFNIAPSSSLLLLFAIAAPSSYFCCCGAILIPAFWIFRLCACVSVCVCVCVSYTSRQKYEESIDDEMVWFVVFKCSLDLLLQLVDQPASQPNCNSLDVAVRQQWQRRQRIFDTIFNSSGVLFLFFGFIITITE